MFTMWQKLNDQRTNLEKRLNKPVFIAQRIAFVTSLFFIIILQGFIYAFELIFLPSQKSFLRNAQRDSKGMFQSSYHDHIQMRRHAHIFSLSSFAVVIISVVIVNYVTFFVLDLQAQPALAATCNISTNTTVDQSYIDINTCNDIHVTGAAIITFTEPINLGGASTFYVDNTVTASFNGAMNLSDSNDSVQIDGTVTHALGNTTGVNITAQTLNITSTGKIDVKARGCAGGTSSSKNGFGPDLADSDADLNVAECIQGQGGYGKLDRGGAAYGGSGGRSQNTSNPQVVTYGAVNTPIYLGSGGAGGPNGGENGGAGGGLVRLDITGTLTVNGTINAAGANSASASTGAGGGSGGSIHITTGTLAGTSTINANGGNGYGSGGGGGGGRIAIYYDVLSGFTLSNVTASLGIKGGAANTADGGAGTTFILDRKIDDGSGTLTATSGLEFQNGVDFTRTNLIFHNNAAVKCDTFATLDIGATSTLDMQGVSLKCTSVDTVNISAGTWLTSNTNALDFSKDGIILDWNILNDITFNNTTVNSGRAGTASASGGVITLDNPINVSLVNSSINSSVNWTGLESLNIDATSKINASTKGCTGGSVGSGTTADGFGPNISTGICAQTTSGYGKNSRGGAAHAGNGGRGQAANNGQFITYGSSHIPTLFGSGGGGGANGGEIGGTGGGYVRLDVTGTLTVNGDIQSNGGASPSTANGAGGGSGGSIHINTGVLAGSATITANGGNGYLSGGGGGGGRVAVYYDSLSGFVLSQISTAKGLKGADVYSADGGVGSTFLLNRKTDDGNGDLTITTGLDFNSEGDYTRANITAYNGASLSCGTFGTLNVSASAAIDLQGVFWKCDSVDAINFSAATWTNSNINTISFAKPGAVVDWNITNDLTLTNLTYTGGYAGSASASGGVLSLDNPINITLVNTDINSSINWTGVGNVSIDADSSISATAKGCNRGVPTSQNGAGPNTSTGICAQTTSGYGKASRGGAAHAGVGGRGITLNTEQTTTYGSNTQPTMFGSGGGGGGNGDNFTGERAGYGGGKIRLDSIGTVTVNGSIKADGETAPASAGGGAGGSIYLTIQTLAGGGSISVNGGNGVTNGGGGGGGRAALYYTVIDGFTLGNITATKGLKGGGVGTADGTDGTVYILQYSAPTTPSPTLPSNASTDQNRTPTLTSSAYSSNGASHTTSDWQISDDNTFSDDCSDINIVWCSMDSANKESIVANSTNGSFQNALSGKGSLAANTTYYFRVRHTNAIGDSSWSAANTFTTTTNVAPSQPTNSAPSNSATDIALNPTLAASAFSDGDGDSHVSSSWVVYESNNCSGTAVWTKSADVSNLTSTLVNTTNGAFADTHTGQSTLKSHTTYSFKTNYNDGTSTSTDSACTSFTTTNAAPTLSSSVANQELTEDTNVSSAFDLDSYFTDTDWNDTVVTCSITNDFDAGLGTMTLSGDNTVGFVLVANANGSDTIQFACQDAGGASTSTNVITATIAPVNDAPSFVKGANQSVNEDAGGQIVAGWATSLSAGPSNESGQTLTFNVGTNNDALFSTLPTINTANGNLSYVPAVNANGSATVTASIADNGGVSAGGVDRSADQTFTITINPVNDIPTANAGSDVNALEDAVNVSLNGSSSADIDGDTLAYSWSELTDSSDGCGINNSTSVQPTITVLNRSSNYSCVFSLTVNDGTVDSASDSVTVNVTAENDPPTLTEVTDKVVDEGDTLTFAIGANDADTTIVDLGVSDPENTFGEKDIAVEELFTDNRNNTGTFVWNTEDNDSGSYQAAFIADDTTTTVQRIVNISVTATDTDIDTNIAPVFSGSLPNIGFVAGTTTATIFDLDNYFSDDLDELTYLVSGNNQIDVTIESGAVVLSAPIDFVGSEELLFTAVDSEGLTAASNSIIVTVSESPDEDTITLDDVSHVDGTSIGTGIVTIYDASGNELSSWQAFPSGGVIPRLATVKGNRTLVFTIKQKPGTSTRVYTLNGTLVKKKRISPEIHWRKMAVGQLDKNTQTEEIVLATARGRTVYFKVYSFRSAQNKFTLRKRAFYRAKQNTSIKKHIRDVNFKTSIQNKRVVLKANSGKTFFRWKAF